MGSVSSSSSRKQQVAPEPGSNKPATDAPQRPTAFKTDVDHWAQWTSEEANACACGGGGSGDQFRSCFSESVTWETVPLFNPELYRHGVTSVNSSEYVHMDVQVTYKCDRCQRRFRKTYEFFRDGKSSRIGFHAIRTGVCDEFNIRLPFARIEACFEQMWSDNYHFLMRNCHVWACEFWNSVLDPWRSNGVPDEPCTCPSQLWTSDHVTFQSGRSTVGLSPDGAHSFSMRLHCVLVSFTCSSCKHSFVCTYEWFCGQKRILNGYYDEMRMEVCNTYQGSLSFERIERCSTRYPNIVVGSGGHWAALFWNALVPLRCAVGLPSGTMRETFRRGVQDKFKFMVLHGIRHKGYRILLETEPNV